MIKLIASDLDNTALYEGELYEANKSAIRRALDEGVEFVAVTGRGLSAIPDAFWTLKGFCYAITSNGACITKLDTGEKLAHYTIDSKDVVKLIKIAIDYNAAVEIFVDGRAYVSTDYYLNPVKYGMPEGLVPYVTSSRTPVESILGLINDNLSNIDNFAFVVKDAEMHKNVVAKVRDMCPDTFVVDCEPQWVEVMNPLCNKGNSLMKLAEYLGINADEIAAVGDGDNDIEMLEYAGFSVAMGNASPKLKEIADFITLDVQKDGLAYAIDKILKEYR